MTKDANNKLLGRKFGQAYGIFYIDDFGPEWKEYHRFLKLDEQKKGALGACLVCHSLGAGYSGGLFTEYSAGKLPPRETHYEHIPQDTLDAARSRRKNLGEIL